MRCKGRCPQLSHSWRMRSKNIEKPGRQSTTRGSVEAKASFIFSYEYRKQSTRQVLWRVGYCLRCFASLRLQGLAQNDARFCGLLLPTPEGFKQGDFAGRWLKLIHGGSGHKTS